MQNSPAPTLRRRLLETAAGVLTVALWSEAALAQQALPTIEVGRAVARRAAGVARTAVRAAVGAPATSPPATSEPVTAPASFAAPGETFGRGPTGVVGYVAAGTSTATKTNTPIMSIPQSITILTKQQLQDRGSQSLGQALTYVPGVTVAQGEGNRDQITIRGQNTTADFFTDGVRDDAEYYRDLYNIQAVEVLKGPSALTFGRGGGGGVVNRVHQKGRRRDHPRGVDQHRGASAASGSRSMSARRFPIRSRCASTPFTSSPMVSATSSNSSATGSIRR